MDDSFRTDDTSWDFVLSPESVPQTHSPGLPIRQNKPGKKKKKESIRYCPTA